MIKVINIISDTNFGGAGRCLLTFIDNYDRNKIDLEVFIPFGSELEVELIKRKCKYTEVRYINDASFNFKAVSALLKLFKEREPDVVHSHAAMSARVAAKLYGKCKIIYTRHSVFDQPMWKKTFPAKQILGGINNYFCDKIIAVSPAAKQNLVETGVDGRKIHVVFNGVDEVPVLPPEKRFEIREKWGVDKGAFVVSIIARVEAVKGHGYVIDCAAQVAKVDPKVVFIIAGTGSLLDELKARVKNEGLENVIFLGFVKEVGELENISDLIINASYGTEATSCTLLEGLSLGIPAVVTDFGGNPYVIKNKENGLVVNTHDAAALAKAVLKIKDSKALYKRLSENARESFLQQFTADVMVDKISGLYGV